MNTDEKLCRTCKFWGATTPNTQRAPCLYPIPASVTKRSTAWVTSGCATWAQKDGSEQV